MPDANTRRKVDIGDPEFGLVVIGNGATWSRVYGEYSLAVLFTCNFGSMGQDPETACHIARSCYSYGP